MNDALGKLRQASNRSAAIKTLETLIKNVVKDPSNPKFLRVRTTNKKIQQSVIDVPGGEQLLVSLGFQRNGEFLELPSGVAVLEGTRVQWETALAALASIRADEDSMGDSCSIPSQTLMLSRELIGHTKDVRSCCHIDGGSVVTGSLDNTIRVWRRTAGGVPSPPEQLQGHTMSGREEREGVLGLAYSSETGELASCGRDGKLVVWSTASSPPVVTNSLAGHGSAAVTNGGVVSCVAVAAIRDKPDNAGKKAVWVTGGWDKTARSVIAGCVRVCVGVCLCECVCTCVCV